VPTVFRFLQLLVLAYGLYALMLTVLQRQLIFPGRGLQPLARPVGVGADAEQLWISTSFGSVEALFIASPMSGKQPLVLLFHGNGGLIDDLHPEYARLRQMGYGLLLVEYPGYGHSGGVPSQRSLAETALAAFDYLIKRPEVDSEQVIVFGSSLGSSPAIALAVQRPVRALILAAPPASLRPLAHQRWLPSFLLFDTFDNAALIRQYTGPTLVLHGRYDSVIPFSHGQQVAAAAPRGRLVALASDHNDLLSAPGFWQEVSQFLQIEQISAKGRQP